MNNPLGGVDDRFLAFSDSPSSSSDGDRNFSQQAATNQSSIQKNLDYQCARDLIDFSSRPDFLSSPQDFKSLFTCNEKKKIEARGKSAQILEPIELIKNT